jgi:two-component system OmpR family sensor kinase/two-component system sensor histidine kinase BaeS
MMRGRPTLLVVDAQGQVVYDSRNTRVGQALTEAEKSIALPVTNNQQTIGYFVIVPGQAGMMPADQNFLQRLQNTLVTAALIAGAIGVVLGLFISRTIASPLRKLAFAAEHFSHQDWSQRVPVQGTLEVQRVAAAFNQMAASLEQADHLRRNLMADIAHELRTPLTVMQGTLHAMLDDVYPINKAELTTVYDETRLLQRLVDDVRELALADAGQLTLTLQKTNLNTLVQNAANVFTIAADAKGIQVITTIPADARIVEADPDRLSQVLHNLLANTLRHTDEGCICISVVSQPMEANARVSISDTGEGILPEDLPHIFDRFYRGQSRALDKGTGLGLPIAKMWIAAMHGEMGVESTLGKGSEFWFTLPLQPGQV